MKKQDNSVRVDVRIPEDIYSEIEKIAIATNQPYTPKSKNSDNPKPVVTPIILKLIELGLDSLARQGLELNDKEVSDLEADIKLTDLEDRIVKRLENHLRKLVDEQVIEAISQYEHLNKILDDEDINIINQLSDISDLDIYEDNESLEDITPDNETIEDNSENETNETIEDNSEPNLLPKEVESEDKEQGLSMGKLAERFKTNKNEGKGASKTSISTNLKKLSKEAFINWSKENDPENKGWYRNEADNLFYLQK